MSPVRYKKKGKVHWELRSWHLLLSAAVITGIVCGLGWLLWPFWDLSGQFGVQGAIVDKGKNPEIITAEGSVSYKSTLTEVPIAAAAPKK